MAKETTPPAISNELIALLENDAFIEQITTSLKLERSDVTWLLERFKDGAHNGAEAFGLNESALTTIENAALTYYRTHNYPMARAAYSLVLDLDPQHSSSWRGLGACWHAEKAYQQALLALEKALKITPQDIISCVLYGECLAHLNKLPEAIVVIENALKITPTSSLEMMYHKQAQALFHVWKPATAAQPTPAEPDPKIVSRNELEQKIRDSDYNDEAIEELLKHPDVTRMLDTLAAGVADKIVPMKTVAGISDEQLEAAYMMACRYLQQNEALRSMQILGWLIYFDARNGKYYHLCGITAMHVKMWCFADYMFAMALIWGEGQSFYPAALIYQGESKILSRERHAGLDLLRRGIAACSGRADLVEVANRGQLLLRQYGESHERKAT